MQPHWLILLRLFCDLLGLAMIAASLPLVLELLILSSAALFPPRPSPRATGHLRMAVIVPAHDEEKLITKTVESLLAQRAEDVSVYVVAHNCSDFTAERARHAGANVLVLNDAIGGKGLALDHGFREAIKAGAQAVLVVDADSVAGPDMLARVSAALASGAEAVQCRYEVANAEATPRTRLMALAFLGINVVRPLGRSRLGLSSGIFGNGFSMRAETLADVPYTANSLVEDLEYHLHLVRAGITVQFLDDATVYGEMPERSSAAGSQRARWEGGRKLMRRAWTGPLALEVLRGRPRLLEPLLDLQALPLASGAFLLGTSLVLGLAAHITWLSAYAAVGIAGVLLYLIASITLSPKPANSLAALLGAPGYLLWKLMMIPRTRAAARRDAAWIRTTRNDE